MQSKAVPGFLPSTSGLHFTNRFPTGIPVKTLQVPGIPISIPLGDASNGVCGGMTYVVLDLFMSSPRLLPPTDTATPGAGSAITTYVVNRLVDSFALDQGVHSNVARYLGLMSTPDSDEWFVHGVPWLVVNHEWPKIKADIDAGRPSPLGLVGGTHKLPADISGMIGQLAHCHQVLAYAYVLDDSKVLTLRVYDPNDPDDDESTISMTFAHPDEKTTIKTPRITSNISGHGSFRALFRHDHYSRKTPPAGVTAGPAP